MNEKEEEDGDSKGEGEDEKDIGKMRRKKRKKWSRNYKKMKKKAGYFVKHPLFAIYKPYPLK